MTEFRNNLNVKDNWNRERIYASYGLMSLNPPFLNYFCDEIRFQFKETLSKNEAVDESLRQLRRSFPFEYDGEAEVLDYIHNNDNIYLAVMHSIAAVADIFPGCVRTLSIHHDPESDDEYLVLSIGFEKYPVDLFELMESLEPRYLPSLEKAVSGWLSVIPVHISL